MISIGAVYRGPELKGTPINLALMNASVALRELRGPLGDGPCVNAVFVVPGSLGETGFRDLEFGEYEATERGVVVRIPVPSDVARGSDPLAWVLDALRGANAMAFEFFRQRGEEFELAAAEDMLRAAGARLGFVRPA